jgi:nitrogen-specific signal transduction histidine kinase
VSDVFELDARTILFVTFATNLTMAYFIWAQRRPPIPSAALAARLWSSGFALIGVGGLLLSLQGKIPDLFGEFLGESLGIGGYSLVIFGTRAFLDRPINPRILILIVMMVPTTSFWFSIIDSDDRMRVILLSAWGVLNCWWLIVSLRPWVPATKIGTRTRIPAAIMTGIYSLVIAFMGIQVMLGPSLDNLLTASSPTILTIALLHMMATFYSLWCMFLLSGKMSSALNREIRKRDRMLSVLAHDLRTPFNGLIGGSEALRMHLQRGDTARARDMADNVHAASGQALSLVESLLFWGRNQLSGASTEPVPVGAAIANAVAPFEQSCRNKRIQLRTSCSPAFTAIAEPGGLETIVRNLLSNAIKFSSEGGVVDLQATEDAGEIMLKFRDQGIGMGPDTLQRIRQRAGHVSATGTAGEAGTGLGLSFCHDLLDSYGGRLEVDSSKAMGTTVRVFLKAGPDVAQDVQTEAHAA